MFLFPFWAVSSCCHCPSGSGPHLGQMCWLVPTCVRPTVVIGGIMLCLRPLFTPCRYRRVSWWSSLWLRVFGCSWLSPVFFPIRCEGYRSTSMTLDHGLRLSLVICPRSFRLGFEPLSGLLFAPCSCRRVFSWWSSLGQRVFGSPWLSPLFFPVRW